MWDTWVQFLDQEDPLEKGMETHSSIFAWRIPWTEGPGGLHPWGCKESDKTEQLTLTNINQLKRLWLVYLRKRMARAMFPVQTCGVPCTPTKMSLDLFQLKEATEIFKRQATGQRKTRKQWLKSQGCPFSLWNGTWPSSSPPPTPALHPPPVFCLWKNFSQRISLIRKVRKSQAKKNTQTGTNNNSLVSKQRQGHLVPAQGLQIIFGAMCCELSYRYWNPHQVEEVSLMMTRL